MREERKCDYERKKLLLTEAGNTGVNWGCVRDHYLVFMLIKLFIVQRKKLGHSNYTMGRKKEKDLKNFRSRKCLNISL